MEKSDIMKLQETEDRSKSNTKRLDEHDIKFKEMSGKLEDIHELTYSIKEIATEVKNSAYEIINKKHATYYGIAMSVKRICEVIMRDEKSIIPVSHMIHGQYEIEGVSLSMPVIVGADGIESDVPINLNGEEALKLKESADSLKKIIDTLEL